MGDAAFRTGWQVVRSRYADALPERARRRRRSVALIVAAVVAAAGITTEVVWSWADTPVPIALLGILFVAAGLGAMATVFVRTAPSDVDWSFRPTGDWRRSERVRRQLVARPPAMRPEDRAEVLAAVERSRDGFVRAAVRTSAIPVFWACVWIGGLLVGAASDAFVLAFFPLIGLLQCAAPIAAVTALGRGELARQRAEALPAADDDVPRPARRPGTGGSKLRLPGD